MEKNKQITLVFTSTLLSGIFAVLLAFSLPPSTVTGISVPATPDTFLNLLGVYLSQTGAVLVLLIPFLFLSLYFLYGRETTFAVVPEFLSSIPNRNLTPFQVNLLFKGTPHASDEDGFYATLLDLDRKKKIKISDRPDKRGVIIRICNYHGDDEYEQSVIDFLLKYRVGGVTDTGYFKDLVSEAYDHGHSSDQYYEAKRIQRHLNSLMYRTDDVLTQKYVSNGTKLVVPFFIIGALIFIITVWVLLVIPNPVRSIGQLQAMIWLSGIVIVGCLPEFIPGLKIYERVSRPFMVLVMIVTEFILALFVALFLVLNTPNVYLDYVVALFYSLVILIQASVAFYYGPTIFSRWKEDHYREKLEWDAFGRFLSDLSHIEKYNRKNGDTWGEWLVYGTALGLGERISTAAKVYGVDISYPYSDDPRFPWFGNFYTLSVFIKDNE